MMDEFGALVHSLGEHAVSYIRRENLKQLEIMADPMAGAAHIEICLSDDNWAAQSAAIDKMIELREMFLDEISIDYVFVDRESCGQRSHEREPEFSLA